MRILISLGIVGAIVAAVILASFMNGIAHAGLMSQVSDTISDSDLGAIATHTVSYTHGSTTSAGDTITITFDPNTNLFDGVQDIVFGDLQFIGGTLVSTSTACSGPTTDEVYFTSTSTTPGDESIVFTVCPTDTLASGTISVVVSNRISNPTTTGSYIIRVEGTAADYKNTRVAIIDDVVVTAAVNTTFTFVISGVASGTTINGVTTTIDSTTTTLPFGTLAIDTPTTLGQELRVTTNAANGFAVTVMNDQPLQSSNGADIDYFYDGDATTTPISWASPSGNVSSEDTFGHIGLTSEDSDLNGGEFVGSLFAGNFYATSTRTIFSHTGPADGTTADIGLTQVAYRVEITVLQEPGVDYSNVLTYVATPTF